MIPWPDRQKNPASPFPLWCFSNFSILEPWKQRRKNSENIFKMDTIPYQSKETMILSQFGVGDLQISKIW